MKVTQVAELLNTVAQELLGESIVVNEDLSNVVDVGTAIMNTNEWFENYTRAVNDVIGRDVFVNRRYSGRAPSVLMDGWEYGSILRKTRAGLPDAEVNESWELQDGASYDPNIFHKPEVSTKFYNSKTTFEIAMSFTIDQAKSAFRSAEDMNGFFSMIRNAIENKMTILNDALIMRTINAMIAETVYNEFSAGTYTGASGVRAVNLLYLYNQAYTLNITAAEAITDPAFIRFASYTIKNYMDRMKTLSTLFNVGQTEKFTPEDRMKLVMLSEFKNAAEIFLYSGVGQFREDRLDFTSRAESVAYWQGSGIDYAFDSTGEINVVTPSGHSVDITGVLACIFDRDALGVSNYNRRTTTHYNAKAEFINEFHKADAGYFNDLDENFVVFFVA